MGGQVIATRGGMIHMILQLCRQFEDAFTKAIDGGKGGESEQTSQTVCQLLAQRVDVSGRTDLGIARISD